MFTPFYYYYNYYWALGPTTPHVTTGTTRNLFLALTTLSVAHAPFLHHHLSPPLHLPQIRPTMAVVA